MCGIAGLAGNPDRSQAASLVRRMTQALARRGPDAEGLEVWDGAALGHRRLAVFDLSDAGRQPMLSPDRRVGVVFNGAIYNFKALRAELEAKGYRFGSATDTEVLVHGYAAWGIDALVDRLHGMFAFALWDDATQTLFLVRDRLGVKPLLFCAEGAAIAFASTMQAFECAGLTKDIDEGAVAEFFEFGFISDERSIYTNVRKLPAAHIAQWHDGALRMRRYWQPGAPQENVATFDEAVEETERRFLRAVEMRLAADVPVGALLSGGIDSSLVCWAIAKLGGNVTAYTIATPGDPWDESADARTTAAELGLRHRVLASDPSTSPDVETLVSAYGEPFACASALGMLSVSAVVKQEATVLLTGDGGDDVFLGYPRHAHYAAAQRLARRLPAVATPVWRAARSFVPKSGALRRAAHFIDYTTGGLGAVAAAHAGLPVYRDAGMLGERLAGASVPYRDLPWSVQGGRTVLDDFLVFERKTRFVGEYMTKVDGATMYHALEARAPFLDQSLWEYASALPYETRLHGGTLKSILREIARRRIGERVARGAKRGFGIPVQRWIAGRWNSAVQTAFHASVLERNGWVRGEPIVQHLKVLREGETAPMHLWYLYVLEAWMRRRESEARAVAIAG